MYGQYHQGMSGGWWVLMVIGMVVFLAILVVGVIASVRHYGSGNGSAVSPPPDGSAIAILKERFARGELSEEENLRRLKMLKGES